MIFRNAMNIFSCFGRIIDAIICIFCIAGFSIELFYNSCTDYVEKILGLIGLVYCGYYFLICFRPIKRDWILAKGGFLIKVINFVLLIPFVLVLFLIGGMRKILILEIWYLMKIYTYIMKKTEIY